MDKTSEWLSSLNKYSSDNSGHKRSSDRSRVISITSGKGGVGKTSISLKIAKLLSKKFKTLLIDCDINLSNTSIRLGIPIENNFHCFINGEKTLDECLYKDGNFHLLPSCNGNMEIFKSNLKSDKIILNIINQYRNKYEYIILDCSADITQVTLNLNAYSDDRFIVVVPDKASITDSYSLIKILAAKYMIKENYLIVNKVSNIIQYQKIIKTLGDTVDHFVGGRLKILGSILLEKELRMEDFDTVLLNEEKSSLHYSFIKLVKNYTEMTLGVPKHLQNNQSIKSLPYDKKDFGLTTIN